MSEKQKKKKKKVLSSFCNFSTSSFISNFPPSLLQFPFFSSQFSPLFTFSLPLLSPIGQQKISQSEVSGGTLPPACYATGHGLVSSSEWFIRTSTNLYMNVHCFCRCCTWYLKWETVARGWDSGGICYTRSSIETKVVTKCN